MPWPWLSLFLFIILVCTYFSCISLIISISIRRIVGQVKKNGIHFPLSVLLKRNYMELWFQLIDKVLFYIMLIFQLFMLTFVPSFMGNSGLASLLELILNGFHFHFASISLSNKNWEITLAHKWRGNIFCRPFLQKDDLDKFVHILFQPITAEHNTSHFNYLSNKLAMQLYHFHFSSFLFDLMCVLCSISAKSHQAQSPWG